VDEDEYLEYCNAVFGMTQFTEQEFLVGTAIYDEDGRVPGCSRTLPAPSYE